jgi:hypothetical protein
MLDHTMAKKKTNDNEAYKNKIFPTDNMTGRAAGQKKASSSLLPALQQPPLRTV